MSKSGMPISEPLEIGARVRMIRRRRGLGLETAAGLAGISKSPELRAFAMFALAPSIARMGGRGRGLRMIDRTIDESSSPVIGQEEASTGPQMIGMLHLMAAHLRARTRDDDAAMTHLAEATDIANAVGEGNAFHQHFGPTNVAVWKVAVGTELGHGPAVAEQAEAANVDLAVLQSRDRAAAWHCDLAHSYGTGSGNRDREAIRHLDQADRLAPQRIRNDPLARDLALELNRRATRPSWELTSLRNRFGMG